MRIKILNKFWNLKWVTNLGKAEDGEDIQGKCDPPNKKNKEIRIKGGIKGEEELDVLIHEILHAANWYMDEEHVTNVSADIARILWKLGYRRNDDNCRKCD